MEQPTRENTLFLPIKQVYFNQIINGTKKEEFREIKDGLTANKYLQKDVSGNFILNPDVTSPNKEYFIDDYNNGNFPFKPIEYKYLMLSVGYTDNCNKALVQVVGYKFLPDKIRGNLYAFWQIVYELGDVVEIHWR